MEKIGIRKLENLEPTDLPGPLPRWLKILLLTIPWASIVGLLGVGGAIIGGLYFLWPIIVPPVQAVQTGFG